MLLTITPMLTKIFILAENKNGTSLCLVESQKCGFTTSNPPVHHGDCCPGLDCEYEAVGGGGRCKMGTLSI